MHFWYDLCYVGSPIPQDMLPWILPPPSAPENSQAKDRKQPEPTHLHTNPPFVDMDLLYGTMGRSDNSFYFNTVQVMCTISPRHSRSILNTIYETDDKIDIYSVEIQHDAYYTKKTNFKVSETLETS